jgi:hypothetical protein
MTVLLMLSWIPLCVLIIIKCYWLLIIAVNNMLTLSLNVFVCLNACGLYNACMSYVKGVHILVTESDKSLGNSKVVL